ncbi:MAG: HAMP domain-containing protein [Acidobacteria bacterium]|nr:HAMP domain-containing protein [Acidobacteriota bacterium]
MAGPARADRKADLKMRPGFIIGVGVIVLLSIVSLFGLTSLNLPFINPTDSEQTILLFVLSTIIFLGLVIFGFILFRSLLKLYLERRANQLGSKFKTKLVCGALGLSLLPVCFLFLFSYSLMNRTLDKWFSRPYETMSQDTHRVVQTLEVYAQKQAVSDARQIAQQLQTSAGQGNRLSAIQEKLASIARPEDVDYIGILDVAGKPIAERRFEPEFPIVGSLANRDVPTGDRASTLFEMRGSGFVLGGVPLALADGAAGILVTGAALPAHISESATRLNEQSVIYGELSRQRKFLRKTYISILFLLTVVILFIATWFALFLSRQITVPIQALAEATHEVSRGNLHFRVRTRAADELGILVQSFNEMTEQLAAGRSELEKSRNHLEEMNRQLDQRRRFTEAILESIPTGVISLSGKGIVLGSNTAASRLFGRDLRSVGHLSNLFGPEDVRELDYLMKRAARMGQAMRQSEVKLEGRVLNLAITVSSLTGDPPGSATSGREAGWFVVVLEDMSELLRAQKAAAWGEVAQRIAHEIKNPLTPIALSAERIRLWFDRRKRAGNGSAELGRVVEQSCALIHQEVENLKRLVDEFAQFSRFPKAAPTPASLNRIVESAVSLFNGRLDGVSIRTSLSPDLPQVMADCNQFRRVLVNLIDNACDAMENSLIRDLVIETRADAVREVAELIISDTGHGVSPEDKEKLFLPYFSTKERGTGLGLAIVSRIIAEHDGIIRVEENHPVGTRFIIELPVVTSNAVV